MATFNGTGARDVLFGTRFDDVISGNAGNDVLSAGAGNDFMYGGAGADVMDGGENTDNLLGGTGNDLLVGGTGGDVLWGDSKGAGGGTSSKLVTTSNTTTISSTGQDFSVSLTAPDASGAASYAISGLVSAGPVSTTGGVNIAIAIDISGSTSSIYSGTAVGDMNNNGTANEVLDGEIAGALAAIKSIIAAGYGNAMINLIAFESGVNSSVTMRADADTNNNGILDAEEYLRGLNWTGGTNFEPPLQEAISFFQGRPAGGANYVFFMSDGSASTYYIGDETATLTDPNGINATIRAFPIGQYADAGALDILDDGVANNSAPTVTDPGAISTAISGSGGITAADIKHVLVYVDGQLKHTIPAASLVATPLGLKFDATLTGLNTTQSETVRVVAVATDGSSTTVATSQVVENLSADGNDTLIGGTGSDDLYGEGGNDVLLGGEADDFLDGGAGADTMGGGEGRDRMFGNAGWDRMWGEAGDDTVNGGAGNDILGGAEGEDALFGGADHDLMYGGDQNDTLAGDTGADTLYGGNGNDALYAGGGNDQLWGGAGKDDLWAGVGADTLNGGGGNDSMAGGGGADTFVFANNSGADLIRDFADDVDTLNLNDNLWSGTLTVSQVLSTYGSIVGGKAVLNFGGGDVLTLNGISNLNDLVDDITIV